MPQSLQPARHQASSIERGQYPAKIRAMSGLQNLSGGSLRMIAVMLPKSHRLEFVLLCRKTYQACSSLPTADKYFFTSRISIDLDGEPGLVHDLNKSLAEDISELEINVQNFAEDCKQRDFHHILKLFHNTSLTSLLFTQDSIVTESSIRKVIELAAHCGALRHVVIPFCSQDGSLNALMGNRSTRFEVSQRSSVATKVRFTAEHGISKRDTSFEIRVQDPTSSPLSMLGHHIRSFRNWNVDEIIINNEVSNGYFYCPRSLYLGLGLRENHMSNLRRLELRSIDAHKLSVSDFCCSSHLCNLHTLSIQDCMAVDVILRCFRTTNLSLKIVHLHSSTVLNALRGQNDELALFLRHFSNLEELSVQLAESKGKPLNGRDLWSHRNTLTHLRIRYAITELNVGILRDITATCNKLMVFAFDLNTIETALKKQSYTTKFTKSLHTIAPALAQARGLVRIDVSYAPLEDEPSSRGDFPESEDPHLVIARELGRSIRKAGCLKLRYIGMAEGCTSREEGTDYLEYDVELQTRLFSLRDSKWREVKGTEAEISPFHNMWE
ncbi:hypothetical protein B0J11DRAFT_505383 [Dendryphion nanum]|uniref:Uncharacterized protein n=1 Tax=Dendryphion nanum TaxID=256645 RepID=A0A9P9DY77_9PLEO|nr:hypothetical protein B0J11DRAFT_505383 [Dendryphion nanum]